MKLNFRHGIISANMINGILSYLQIQDNSVKLLTANNEFIFTIAEGIENYLFSITSQKTLCSTELFEYENNYIFLEVNKFDLSIEAFISNSDAIISAIAPYNPDENAHWFDTINNTMKVFINGTWQNRLRICIGYITSSNIVVHKNIAQSTVGVSSIITPGYVIKDNYNRPILLSNSTLLNQSSELLSNFYIDRTPILVKPNSPFLFLKAQENIPIGSPVGIINNGNASLSSNLQPIGLVNHAVFAGEVCQIICQGNITNDQWDWHNFIGKHIYKSPNGELTPFKPTGSYYIIGTIINTNSIFVNIQFVENRDETINATNGQDGKSTYEIAVDNGFVGSVQEWLDSLNGVNGVNGLNGASAYQVALSNGFIGTELEWLDSLRGRDVTSFSLVEISVDTILTETHQDKIIKLTQPDLSLTISSGLVTSWSAIILLNGQIELIPDPGVFINGSNSTITILETDTTSMIGLLVSEPNNVVVSGLPNTSITVDDLTDITTSMSDFLKLATKLDMKEYLDIDNLGSAAYRDESYFLSKVISSVYSHNQSTLTRANIANKYVKLYHYIQPTSSPVTLTIDNIGWVSDDKIEFEVMTLVDPYNTSPAPLIITSSESIANTLDNQILLTRVNEVYTLLRNESNSGWYISMQPLLVANSKKPSIISQNVPAKIIKAKHITLDIDANANVEFKNDSGSLFPKSIKIFSNLIVPVGPDTDFNAAKSAIASMVSSSTWYQSIQLLSIPKQYGGTIFGENNISSLTGKTYTALVTDGYASGDSSFSSWFVFGSTSGSDYNGPTWAKDNYGNFIQYRANAISSEYRSNITSGTVSIPSNTAICALYGSGTISVNLPSTPINGQILTLLVENNYTSISINGTGTDLFLDTNAGSSLVLCYNSTIGTWRRIGGYSVSRGIIPISVDTVLSFSHTGKILELVQSSINITIPSTGLPNNFSCTIINNGNVTFMSDGFTLLNGSTSSINVLESNKQKIQIIRRVSNPLNYFVEIN